VALGNAWAQSTPAAAAPPAGAASAPVATSNLDTVTISGTRRPELVRDVPLSIQSVPTQQLEEAGARSLNDYLAATPGVVLQNSGILDNTGFVIIRGLTTGIDARSPTTIYLDEVPLGDGAPFDINLLDLNRFEVLRGPQGTLYGASSMGGILKYVTRDPDTTGFYGRAGFGVSQTEHGGTNGLVNAMVNAPLKEDVAALRVAAFGSRDGGYVDATGPAARKDVNRGDSSGGRVNLLLTPTRDLSIKLMAMTQTINADGGSRIVYDLATSSPKDGDLVFSNLGVPEPRKIERDIYSATIEYDLRFARFLSVTSTQRVRDDNTVDLTPLGAALLGSTTAFADSKARNSKTTQEFRLVSTTPGTFQWLAGLFYDDFKETTSSVLTAVGGAVPGVLQDTSAQRDYKEWALYGDVTFNATNNIAITGGLRAAHYKQTDSLTQGGALIGPPTTTQIGFSESPTTYLLTAKYKLTPQSNLYARAASGYRPGGVNNAAVDPLTGAPIPGVPPSYGTDKVWTYEAGYKMSHPETGSGFEIAVFQTDWSDIQQATVVNNVAFTSNLGKARIRGIEAAGTLRPTAGLTLGASLSLLDPKLLTDSPGLQAMAGDRLPNSPRTAASLTGRYAFEIGGHSAFGGLNVMYEGERNSGFPNTANPPNYKLPAFTQVDLTGGINLGRFDVNLYVRNLTDERGQLGATTGDAPTLGRTYVHVITPRTFGVNVTAAF
jgi:outer membrane receptor protein involved in Fe transport